MAYEDDPGNPYGLSYMNASDRQKYVNDAKKIMLDIHKAWEIDLIPELTKFKNLYSNLIEEYYQTKKGKVKFLNQKLRKKLEKRNLDLNYGIRKTMEVKLFGEYINWLSIDSNRIRVGSRLEQHVDNLYRREDAYNRLMKDKTIQEPKEDIIIPPGFRVKVSSLTLCRLEREILVEKPKHYIKNMSKEKAERFLSSAKKRANETGTRLIEATKEIASLKEEINKAEALAHTEEAREESFVFQKTLDQFKKDLETSLGFRIKTYLSNHDETPLRRKIKKSLENGISEELKDGTKTELTSGQTLLYLINDIKNDPTYLPDQNVKQ